jgi:hypothetical protein
VIHSLDAVAARVASDKGWRKTFTSNELIESWKKFVSQCSNGYPMSIYEYENDRSVRTMIQEVLKVPDLEYGPSVEEFKMLVAQSDLSFRELLQPGVTVGNTNAYWWERGVPKYAGAELASDFQEIFGLHVEVIASRANLDD